MSISEFPDTYAPTVFYPRHRGVSVTDVWFFAHGRRYAVEVLGAIGWRSGPAPAARVVAVTAIAAVTALAALVALWTGTPTPALLLGAGPYLVLAGSGLWYSFHRWPRSLALGAIHRGVPTVLYTSTDRLEFHKVYRALIRAQELYELEP